MSKPSRSISAATCTISSSEGVIRPERPIISTSLLGRLQYLGRRNHDAEVDHLIVVTRQHDAHDILADIVDIPLTVAIRILPALWRSPCRHGSFSASMKGRRGQRPASSRGGFDHLRQEHLAGAKEVADDIHPVHSGPSIT